MRLRPIPDCLETSPFSCSGCVPLAHGRGSLLPILPQLPSALVLLGHLPGLSSGEASSERMLLSIQASEVMPWWGDTWQFSSACPEGASVSPGAQLADRVVLEDYSSIPPFSTVAVHRVARTCRRSCTGLSLRREFVARAGPGCGCGESAPSWKVQSTPRGVQYVSRRFGVLTRCTGSLLYRSSCSAPACTRSCLAGSPGSPTV